MGERIVGLDIGTSAIRAVEVVLNGDRPPVLEAYGQVGLPQGVIVDGEVRDRSQVAAALRRLWQNGGFRTERVRLGVAGLRAITRELELPPVPPEELDAAVALQAAEIVPFAVDQAAISSSVVSTIVDQSGRSMLRVLVAAAPRDLVNGVVEAVEEAGLVPEAVDLQSAALSRAFTLPGSSPELEAVVSVGAGLTHVVVHHGGTLEFVRTIDIGGDTVTKALSAMLDLPAVDAEIAKRQLEDPGQHDPAATAAAGRVIGDLATEVQSSIRYYSSIPGNAAPTRMLVTGGGARTPGLVAELARRMEVPVLEAAPLSLVTARRIHVDEADAQNMNATLAVPIGLTLDGPARTHFDLLPPEVLARRAEGRVRRMLVVVAVCVALVLAVLSAWRLLAVRSAQQQLATLQSTVHTIKTVELPKYDAAVRVTDRVNTLQKHEGPLVAKEVNWLGVLSQFTTYMPAGTSLETLQLNALSPEGGVTRGAAITAAPNAIGTGTATVSTGSLTQVTDFGLAMLKAPALTRVELHGSVNAAKTGVTFPIDFSINSAAKTHRLSLFDRRIP